MRTHEQAQELGDEDARVRGRVRDEQLVLQRGGDLAKLLGVIEIVQPREQQRLPPVERAEERVLDGRSAGAGADT